MLCSLASGLLCFTHFISRCLMFCVYLHRIPVQRADESIPNPSIHQPSPVMLPRRLLLSGVFTLPKRALSVLFLCFLYSALTYILLYMDFCVLKALLLQKAALKKPLRSPVTSSSVC